MLKKCSINNCEEKIYTKCFCKKHYDHNYYNINKKHCSVDNCKEGTYYDGFCAEHFIQQKNANKCIIDGCERTVKSKSYCSMHYSRVHKKGDPGDALPLRSERGTGYINDTGYRIFHTKEKGYFKEHRDVMEQYIGRKLLPEENVHHKNGDRLDNRIENLELWNTAQPRGQRPEDKIKYAHEILSLYAPEEYAKLIKK